MRSQQENGTVVDVVQEKNRLITHTTVNFQLRNSNSYRQSFTPSQHLNTKAKSLTLCRYVGAAIALTPIVRMRVTYGRCIPDVLIFIGNVPGASR